MDNSFSKQPSPNLVTITYVIYGLHLFGVITGVITSAAIATAFLTGWPSIIAVILNYLKRSETQGTYLESHFSWQIRTFWFAVMWIVIAGIFFITFIGIPITLGIVLLVGLWVMYRMVRGLLRLFNGQAMPTQVSQ